MSEIESRGYAHPDALVSTDWVAQHREDSGVRLVESNEDPLLYASGHIPGAVEVDWTRDLNDPIQRDYLGRQGFEKLMRRIGADKDTTVIFYGDRNNWWATYALWVFRLFGHDKAKVMDGGRIKWVKEGRPLTKDVPSYPETHYQAAERDDAKVRAYRDTVLKHVEGHGKMIDVRSPQEYSGEILAPPGLPETCQRGGHIPGAHSVPWGKACNDDGTFKSRDEL
ncbi:MAG TPA: sulfurtransferase, partial [Thermoanaerobaculia bacterium]|nr:sulfurtransferase [Thermoanaerobaculia bacterium]